MNQIKKVKVPPSLITRGAAFLAGTAGLGWASMNSIFSGAKNLGKTGAGKPRLGRVCVLVARPLPSVPLFWPVFGGVQPQFRTCAGVYLHCFCRASKSGVFGRIFACFSCFFVCRHSDGEPVSRLFFLCVCLRCCCEYVYVYTYIRMCVSNSALSSV